MGKPHPMALRERVVAFVDEGHGHREAARHFRVSPRFVNDLIKLRRETGSLSARRQGNPGRGKLTDVADWVRARLAEKGDLTLDARVIELRDHKDVEAHRSSVGRLLHRLGLSHKKKLFGPLSKPARTWRTSAVYGGSIANPSCPGIWKGLSFWTRLGSRPPAGPRSASGWSVMPRLAIGTHRPSSRLCATTGWTRHGSYPARSTPSSSAPMWKANSHRHCRPATCSAHSLGPVAFGASLLDNLSSHKSPRAARALRDVGAWFLFLPPYSPDLNPIEMAFAKLKALIRKAAARSYDELWRAVGKVCDLFSPQECENCFTAAGYEAD
jgi:transposase